MRRACASRSRRSSRKRTRTSRRRRTPPPTNEDYWQQYGAPPPVTFVELGVQFDGVDASTPGHTQKCWLPQNSTPKSLHPVGHPPKASAVDVSLPASGASPRKAHSFANSGFATTLQ